MATKRKKGLFTEADKRGLAEKRGLEMGSLFTAEDKRKGLADRKGIEMGKLTTEKDHEGLL